MSLDLATARSSTRPETDAAVERFERAHLALFAAQGSAGRGVRIADGSGRENYAIVRGDGPIPTVLLYGGLGVGAEFAKLAGLLEGRVVIPDRPGYGLTYPMDYRGVDLRGHAAAWMLDLVDGLGVSQVNVIGGSMGGLFAMAFATTHPERVRALGLLGAPAGLDRRFPLFLRLYANPLSGRVISRIRMSPTTLRDRAFSGYLTHPERLSMEWLEVAGAGGALPGTGLSNRTLLNAVANLRGQRPEVIMQEAMTSLEVPTRFVWGDQDSFLPSAHGADLARRMKHGQLAVIEDAGHIPHLDQPEAVAAAVNSFLRAPAP